MAISMMPIWKLAFQIATNANKTNIGMDAFVYARKSIIGLIKFVQHVPRIATSMESNASRVIPDNAQDHINIGTIISVFVCLDFSVLMEYA